MYERRWSLEQVINATPQELLKALMDGPVLFQYIRQKRLMLLRGEQLKKVERQSKTWPDPYVYLEMKDFDFREREGV